MKKKKSSLKNEDKEFYNKNSKEWDYYSGLPNPRFYESNGKKRM